MDYPRDKLSVYLLDDGGTDQKCNSDNPVTAHAARARRAELQKLCADLGVHYLTREKNVHAKAGNLNAALPKTSGDLVAVFDADHAPTRDFLVRTVGHFADDPRLFLVQTPHFFLNPDPVERNLSLFEKMPSENEMFYGVIQRGLDKWNAAFFGGSAALLRRALEERAGARRSKPPRLPRRCRHSPTLRRSQCRTRWFQVQSARLPRVNGFVLRRHPQTLPLRPKTMRR